MSASLNTPGRHWVGRSSRSPKPSRLGDNTNLTAGRKPCPTLVGPGRILYGKHVRFNGTEMEFFGVVVGLQQKRGSSDRHVTERRE